MGASCEGWLAAIVTCYLTSRDYARGMIVPLDFAFARMLAYLSVCLLSSQRLFCLPYLIVALTRHRRVHNYGRDLHLESFHLALTPQLLIACQETELVYRSPASPGK
jgi:hypothetical protein